jgi:hypothetical protein
VRGIASIVVAVCLLAASGVRAEDTSRGDARTSQLLAAGQTGAASLVQRRDGARGGLHDLRLAPFTLPARPAVAPASRSIAAVVDRAPHRIVDDVAPARSARGPPRG